MEQLEFAVLNLGQVEQVVDKRQQVLATASNDLQR